MAKITSRGIRAKGRYFPKYFIKSGSSFFEKNKKGVDLIKKVVRPLASIKIKISVIYFLDSTLKSI